MFAQNTGFIWEIAPEFSAMVVFAEHRYGFVNKTIKFSATHCFFYSIDRSIIQFTSHMIVTISKNTLT